MADHGLLLQALRSFAIAMGGSYDVNEMSYELCERVTGAVGATGAGVSVADAAGVLKFITATDDTIVQIEELQQQSQQGPCVAAYGSQRPVTVEDIETVTDWPKYATAAKDLDFRAVVGYPLGYAHRRLGALDIYDSEPRAWTPDDLDVIGVFADMATAYLVRVSELAETRHLADQLQNALDSRVIIEQAKGILAGENGFTVDEAFSVLRKHSRDNNLRLVELCSAVVNLGVRLPDGR